MGGLFSIFFYHLKEQINKDKAISQQIIRIIVIIMNVTIIALSPPQH